jgi:hypothetical protein
MRVGELLSPIAGAIGRELVNGTYSALSSVLLRRVKVPLVLG